MSTRSGSVHVVRNSLPLLREAVDAFRVVVINGPRQSGKSTLLQDLHQQTGGAVRDLDDEAQLQAATEDPAGFVSSAERHMYIDEFQRGGDALVRAIKRVVDAAPTRTTFVLAGSTNFLTVPTLSESLAGRAVIFENWPFSQGEREGRVESFVDVALATPDSLRNRPGVDLDRQDYARIVVAGGYPEPLATESPRLRALWFDAYVSTVTDRDIATLGVTRRPREAARLLTYLAGSTSHEIVQSTLADDVSLDRGTVKTLLSLLETVFLIRTLPAWSRNPLGKVTRRPKLHVTDTGLVSALHGVDDSALLQPVAPMRGQLFETFVHDELVRQLGWSQHRASLYHWRDRGGAEVDIIIEAPSGQIVGVEVKASATVRTQDFRWLTALRDRLGPQFLHGFVVNLSQTPLAFGDRLTAIPMAFLWRSADYR